MTTTPVSVTYIGGPTALIEIGGVRLLTDPTFDPAVRVIQLPPTPWRNRSGPR